MYRPLEVVALVAVLGLATACSATQGQGTSAEQQRDDAAAGAPAELKRYYNQDPSWGSCDSYATNPLANSVFAVDGLECARLTVPLDYSEPNGETAEIGVLRRPASEPDKRIGSLVVNPGGPGASGMIAAAGRAADISSTELGRKFDLVGFDPRGVGASEPRVKCLNGNERDAQRLDSDVVTGPKSVERTERENRAYARKCAERSGEELLANIGTDSVARDMDVLRAVLGDDKLTYLGYSYGTRIGAEYAAKFPGRVRAMVLDGAMDPREWSKVGMNLQQARGFQRSFEAFAEWCADRQRCALGRDPARAVEAFRGLTKPLVTDPVPALGERELSYSDAQTAVISAFYTKQRWPVLNRGLMALAQGDGRILMNLADRYYERLPDGSYTSTMTGYRAVMCVDAKRVGDRSDYREFNRRYREAAPFTDTGFPVSSARGPCAFWPVPETGEAPKLEPERLPDTLVISTTGDPATPYANGRRLADALGGRMLTFEGEGHTVFLNDNECVNEAGTRYLVDLELPPKGKRCSP